MCNMVQEISTTPANEVWRPIAGFEDLYEVSNLGRVRSLDRYYPDIIVLPSGKLAPYHRKGKMMSLHTDKRTGYVFICLRKNDGKGHNNFVHRLVAQAFIPNPNNLPEINHKDECKTNNRADNLEWCDSRYNKLYGTAIERINAKRSKAIEQLTLDGQHVAFYQSAAIASRMSNGKFRPSSIYMALNGQTKTAYGYLWRRTNRN